MPIRDGLVFIFRQKVVDALMIEKTSLLSALQKEKQRAVQIAATQHTLQEQISSLEQERDALEQQAQNNHLEMAQSANHLQRLKGDMMRMKMVMQQQLGSVTPACAGPALQWTLCFGRS